MIEFAEAAAVIGTAEREKSYFGGNMYNYTSGFSPLTLNRTWSWIWRIFFLMLFTGTGTLVNAFFIATFFVSQELKKKGNIFLACLGCTDLIITALVVPSVIVVMFSNVNENTQLCKILQILTQWSTYAYSVFFMLVALDIYTRLVGGYKRYRVYIAYPIGVVAMLNFTVTLVTAGAGVYYKLDYDYCHREHFGNYWFRFITSVTFYVIPCLVTMCLLLSTYFVMKDRVLRLFKYRRYQQFTKDKNLTHLHLGCYLLFVTAWIPYLVLVNLYPDATDAKYYALIWIGLVRSSLTSFLYSVMNDHFRSAFHDLFIYFCCKGHTTQPINSRHCKYFAGNGVRAHIFENSNSPDPERRREPPVPYVL